MTTFSFDIWDKYWPDEIKDRTNLTNRITEVMAAKGLTVQSIGFTDIAAQADDFGRRTVITVRASGIDSGLNHDGLARYLGLNP